MTIEKQLAWLLLVAVSSSGCSECQDHGSIGIEVPPEEECPSIEEAQTVLDIRTQDDIGEETVTRLDHVTRQLAATLCWYRALLINPACNNNERREILLSSGTPPKTGTIVCDEEGALYGEVSPGGADDCPASVEPSWITTTDFVGADDYPARNVCVYETTYSTSCGDVGSPKFGPL